MAEDQNSKSGESTDTPDGKESQHWALDLSFSEMIESVDQAAEQLGQVTEVMESIRDGSYEADPGETVEMEITNMAGFLDSMATGLHFMGVRLMLLEEYR